MDISAEIRFKNVISCLLHIGIHFLHYIHSSHRQLLRYEHDGRTRTTVYIIMTKIGHVGLLGYKKLRLSE
jgi:hypothetical protein